MLSSWAILIWSKVLRVYYVYGVIVAGLQGQISGSQYLFSVLDSKASKLRDTVV